MWDNARTLTATANGRTDVDADQIEVSASIDVKQYFPGDEEVSSSTGPTAQQSQQGTTGSTSSATATSSTISPGLPPLSSGTLPPDATPAQIATLIAAVQAEASIRANKVINYLKSSNYTNVITKLSTDSINLSPIYRYYDRPNDYTTGSNSRLVGYEATYGLSFRVNRTSDVVGDIIAELPDQGVTEINGITFVVSDSLLEITRRLAVKDATKNALLQLQSAVDALSTFMSASSSMGLQFLELTVVNQGDYRPVPMYTFATAAAAPTDSSSGTLPVVGGSTTITAQVTVKVRV